ncbi:MAG: VOC family protein [Methanolobus sp.]|nr:VOC family protein [Methanolobus sp.]
MDKVTHFHIPAENMRRAKIFYRDVFGWEFTITDMDQDYTLATTVKTDDKQIPVEPGAINGAIFLRRTPDESPSVVVNVQNINDHLEKIERAGGQIWRPVAQVGDFGLFAEIRDTEGNILGLWQDAKK